MGFHIRGGRVLVDGGFAETTVSLEGRVIADVGAGGGGAIFDAAGLLVLPGIVDIHGDAFERVIEPRPNVRFDLELALREADRQLITSGITTAYHGVTWSWEPGLRGREAACAIIDAIDRLRPELDADTRIHLRHETFNLDSENEILGWIAAGRIDCLAFNDHMTGTVKDRHRPEKMAKMVERSGLTAAEFDALVERTYARRAEVPQSLTRLAAAAASASIPSLSHDDLSAEQRAWFRERGVLISEFPTTESAAASAIAAGEATVFGAPNVLRGGSHTGCPAAADMVGKGLCKILASDYYYPALLHAPFKLAADGVCSLGEAWALVSREPARALGLHDRGNIAAGQRGDVVIIDAASSKSPRVVATIAGGEVRYLRDGARIRN